MPLYAVVVFVLIKLIVSQHCVDHDNNPVDWYYVYKLPLVSNNQNKLISIGAAYTFMTSEDYVNGWQLSQISINNSNSIVGLTLKPLFNSQNEMNKGLYVLYNDENPEGSVNFRKGHTKGAIVGNENGAIWLIHSVPRFPSLKTGSYFFPHNGYEYGQSFLCISFDLTNLNQIGMQLKYNDPFIYESNIPEELKPTLPNIDDVINGVKINSTVLPFNFISLVSKAGNKFSSFAKTKNFNKDLYDDWVALALSSSIFVESWLNGPGRLSSDCQRKFHVQNVEKITLMAANLTFTSSIDHSKWAVTTPDTTLSWICVGDINRTKPQEKRGGGTVCFSNNNIATTYQQIVNSVEVCK